MSSTTTKPVMSPGEKGKFRLMNAALHLFALHGVEGVSLRMINREAGHKNNSALHYHFGSKMGVIEALASRIRDWFDVEREPALKMAEQAVVSGELSVRDLLKVFSEPYIRLMQQEDWGIDAVKFLARMELESDAETNSILSRYAGRAMERFTAILCRLLPELSKEEVQRRLKIAISSILMALASHEATTDTYLGNVSFSLEDIERSVLDVLSAGIAA